MYALHGGGLRTPNVPGQQRARAQLPQAPTFHFFPLFLWVWLQPVVAVVNLPTPPTLAALSSKGRLTLATQWAATLACVDLGRRRRNNRSYSENISSACLQQLYGTGILYGSITAPRAAAARAADNEPGAPLQGATTS